MARMRARSSSSYPTRNDRGMNSIDPRPNSLSTPASAISSCGAAWFDGTPRPSCATWSSSCDEVNPTAPSRRACRSRSCMAATSSSVAVRSDASSPMTWRRSAQCPTLAPTFTPTRPVRLSRKSATDPPAKSTPDASASADMPSTRLSMSSSHSRSSGRDGASVNPQLPVSSVVTPCHDAGDAVGSQWSWAS